MWQSGALLSLTVDFKAPVQILIHLSFAEAHISFALSH